MMWMGLLMILPRSGKHVISYNDSLALFTNTTYHLQSVLDDMMSVMGITCDEHQQEWPHCAMGEPESLRAFFTKLTSRALVIAVQVGTSSTFFFVRKA